MYVCIDQEGDTSGNMTTFHNVHTGFFHLQGRTVFTAQLSSYFQKRMVCAMDNCSADMLVLEHFVRNVV